MSWFDTAYAEGATPTWDLGHPQPAILRLVEAGELGPPEWSILDAGCGTGEHALLLAEAGHAVVGVDLAAEAIQRARAKAAERRIAATFLMHDALDLDGLDPRGAGVGGLTATFDAAVDVGLFHTLADGDRARYVSGLAAVIRPGGRAFVLCWSDRNPFGYGPRRITRRELRSAFRASTGWRVDAIDAEELASRLPAGRVHAWLARLTRRA